MPMRRALGQYSLSSHVDRQQQHVTDTVHLLVVSLELLHLRLQHLGLENFPTILPDRVAFPLGRFARHW